MEDSPVQEGTPVVSVPDSKHWKIQEAGDAFVCVLFTVEISSHNNFFHYSIQDPASGLVLTGGAQVGAEVGYFSHRIHSFIDNI